MAKYQPSYVQGEERLDDNRGLDSYVKDLTRAVKQASLSRAEWFQRKSHFYDRRFGRANRGVTVPWVGASDIVPPVIDTMLDELKPPLLNLIFAQPLVYNFLPMDAGSVPRASAAARAMDALLKHRMPDYFYQKCLTIDTLGQFGVATEKALYSYVTRQTTDVLAKAELPPMLSRMAVYDKIAPEQQLLGEKLGAVMLTKQQFDRMAPQFESVLIEWVGLDPEDKLDKVALREIMSWLRNGSKDAKLTIKRRQEVENTPRLIHVPPENIITPACTGDIREAAFICHRMFMSSNEMLQRARDDVWDKGAVDEELSEDGRPSDSPYTDSDGLMAMTRRERVNPGGEFGGESDSRYEVWECCCEWDIDGDGLAERCVITHSPTTGKVFKAMLLPYDHGEWPYVDTYLEVTDNDRLAPRGIPELVDDMERHATAIMRHEENCMVIQTTPTFTYVEGTVASLNPSTLGWVPGLFIPQGSPGEVNALQIPVTAPANEGLLRTYLGMAERRVSGANVGVFDQKPPERRTKAEVDYFSSARQRVLGVRGRLFQEGQRRSGYLLWELFRQFGPKSFWVHVTGEAPIEMTQAQVEGRFSIVPVGAVEDMDPDFRAQKALQNLQLMMQLAPLLAGDIRYQPDLGQAAIDYFEQSMPLTRQRVIKNVPPEQQQMLLQQQQMQAQKAQAIADEATKAIENAPLSDPKMMLTLLKEMRKVMPHKELQQLAVQGQAATQAATTNALRLASSNGR